MHLNNDLNRIDSDYVTGMPSVRVSSSDLLCGNKGNPVTYQMGSSWYGIRRNSFYERVMKRFNRPMMSGTSGSANLLYGFVFHILDVLPMTPDTLIHVLAVIIAQYVPLYHTLTEILIEYADLLPPPRYTCDQDPVEYCEALFGIE